MDHVAEGDHRQSATDHADGEQDEQDAGRLQGKDSCLQQKYGLAREVRSDSQRTRAGGHFTHCNPRCETHNHRATWRCTAEVDLTVRHGTLWWRGRHPAPCWPGAEAAATGAGGGGDGADLPTSATVKAGDAKVAHPLAPGRYRLSLTTSCKTSSISMTQDGGSFTFRKTNPVIKVMFVTQVPGGNFFVEQTDPSCTGSSTIKLARCSAGRALPVAHLQDVEHRQVALVLAELELRPAAQGS